MTKTSVIIVCYNKHVFLEQSLHILDQMDCDVILSMDGGDIAVNPARHPCVKKLVWTKHTTYQRVARFNEGLKHVESEYVILLDEDTVPIRGNYIEAFEQCFASGKLVRGMWTSGEGPHLPPWFSTTNVGLSTDLARELGPFDMRYNGRYGYDDNDFEMEVKALGINVIHGTPDTQCEMKGDAYSGDRSGIVENERLFKAKWHL